jgi:hypothetical protein
MQLEPRGQELDCRRQVKGYAGDAAYAKQANFLMAN